MGSGQSRGQQGFTLTELVMVIVIVGILGVGVTRFITHTVGGYVDTATRQQLATAGLVASEKISRTLRNALPNSIRLNAGQTCIEYIPILAVSTYVSVPIGSAANSFSAVGGLASSVSGRAAVYPIDVNELYSPGSPGPITAVTATFPVGNDEVTVSLSGNHQFATDSPTRRVYIASTPQAFCQVGNAIYRYRNYGFNDPASLPPAGAGVVSELLINQVAAGSLNFSYTPASLIRNAVVSYSFNLQDGDENFRLEQEANIRNVP